MFAISLGEMTFIGLTKDFFLFLVYNIAVGISASGSEAPSLPCLSYWCSEQLKLFANFSYDQFKSRNICQLPAPGRPWGHSSEDSGRSLCPHGTDLTLGIQSAVCLTTAAVMGCWGGSNLLELGRGEGHRGSLCGLRSNKTRASVF